MLSLVKSLSFSDDGNKYQAIFEKTVSVFGHNISVSPIPNIVS